MASFGPVFPVSGTFSLVLGYIPIYLLFHRREDISLIPAELRLCARAAVFQQRREQTPSLRVVERLYRLQVAVIGIEAVKSHSALKREFVVRFVEVGGAYVNGWGCRV